MKLNRVFGILLALCLLLTSLTTVAVADEDNRLRIAVKLSTTSTGTDKVWFWKWARDQMIQQIAEEQQRLSQDTSAAIIHYIHQSYANPDLNVAYLVEHFRLPAREINQFCHDQVHASTKEYIITYRIEQAKRKLVEENHSIAEVALEVGYQNISLFIKVFKNKTGVTPSVYRTEARANAVLLPQ